MNDFLLTRLADFHLGASLLLALSLVIGSLLRQPSQRLTIAWSTCGAVLALALLSMTPGWSVWRVGDVLPAHATAVRAPVQDLSQTAVAPQPLPLAPSPSIQLDTPIAQPMSEPTNVPWTTRLPIVLKAILFVGAVIAIGWLLTGGLAAYRLLKRARPAHDGAVRLLDDLSTPNRAPRLLVSDSLPTAVAIGLWRPAIVLPTRFVASASEADLRAVLAHEHAHIGNGDLRLLALLRLLLIVLWMNPLYWLLRRRVRLDQEALADSDAAELTSRAAYAERLVGWARDLSAAPHLAGAAGLWEGPSQLRRRVALLLDERLVVLRRTSRRWRLACGAACGAIALMASLVSLSPAEQGAEEPPAAAAGESNEEVPPTAAEWLEVFTPVSPLSNYPDSRPGEPNTINGVCLDTEGQPVEGVELYLYRYQTGDRTHERLRAAKTDAEGRFRWDKVIDSPELHERFTTDIAEVYTLFALAPGYATQSIAQEPHRIASAGLDLRFTLAPSARLTGRVTDPAGEPVAGARVRAHTIGMFFHPDDLAVSSARTDADGRYAIGDLSAADYEAERRRQEEQHRKMMENPPEGTDSSFIFAANTATVSVTHPEYAVSKSFIELVPGETNVELAPAATITGRVVDDSGQPVAGAIVNLQTVNTNDNKEWTVASEIGFYSNSMTTDLDGGYTFGSLPAGLYSLRLSLGDENGGDPAWVPVRTVQVEAKPSKTPTTAPDLAVTNGVQLKVRLVDAASGGPLLSGDQASIGNLTISGESGTVTLDSGGGFSIGSSRSLDVEGGTIVVQSDPDSPDSGADKFTFRGGTLNITPGQVVSTSERIHASAVFFSEEKEYSFGYMKLGVSPQGEFTIRVPRRPGGLYVQLLTERGARTEWQATENVTLDEAALEAGVVEYPLTRRKLSVMERGNQAHSLASEGKLVEAIALLDSLVAEAPDNADLVTHRAMLYNKAEQVAKAIAEYERALALKPRNTFWIKNNLAHLLATAEDKSLRDAQRALALAQEALAEAPQPMAQLHDTVAEAHAAMEQYHEAIVAEQQAIQLATVRELAEMKRRLSEYQAKVAALKEDSE